MNVHFKCMLSLLVSLNFDGLDSVVEKILGQKSNFSIRSNCQKRTNLRQKTFKFPAFISQGPQSHILMIGEGSDRGSYFIPQKIPTSEFAYPKKSLLFLAYPKESLSAFFTTPKSPCFCLRPQKIPVSLIDSLLAKISDPKKSLPPPQSPSFK